MFRISNHPGASSAGPSCTTRQLGRPVRSTSGSAGTTSEGGSTPRKPSVGLNVCARTRGKESICQCSQPQKQGSADELTHGRVCYVSRSNFAPYASSDARIAKAAACFVFQAPDLAHLDAHLRPSCLGTAHSWQPRRRHVAASSGSPDRVSRGTASACAAARSVSASAAHTAKLAAARRDSSGSGGGAEAGDCGSDMV